MLAVPAAAAAQAPSAQSVLKRVGSEGGLKVLRDPWDQEETLDHFMAGMSQAIRPLSRLQSHSSHLRFAVSLSFKHSVARRLNESPYEHAKQLNAVTEPRDSWFEVVGAKGDSIVG